MEAAVKCKDGLVTDFFNCPIGLKQGCILSPLLFNIFISIVSKILNEEGMHGLQFIPNTNILHHLFYADDNCIFSTTPAGLQNKLNILHRLSDKLGMQINLDKTKIVVFRKGGYLGRNEKWHYNQQSIEVVNSYVYLGTNFSTRMSFVNVSIPLVSKAKRCVNDILFSLNNLSHFDLSLYLKLFDAKIKPILSYASELWGMSDLIEIERVHLYALKRFLNVSLHCSNKRIYAETGRYPLSIEHKLHCVKYWLKIKHFDNKRIVKQAYECLFNLTTKGNCNWVSSIRDLLCSNGYGIVWITGEVGNTQCFLRAFKQTLIDNYFQNWNTRMLSDEHCSWYYGLKPLIATELYFSHVHLKLNLRNILTKFRLGVSQINCHRYRFETDIILKHCPFCIQTCFEDENHVMFICPVYNDSRKEFLSHLGFSFDHIMNCNFRLRQFFSLHFYNIAKFLDKALSTRSTLLKLRSKE